MLIWLASLLALPFLSFAQITDLGVPRKRYFHDTPWGQLHYSASPTIEEDKPTLVLFHGNPNSAIVFKGFLNDPLVKGHYNFIAPDYFGQGSSDDCVEPACMDPDTAPAGSHTQVSFPEYCGVVEDILSERGVTTKLILVGELIGSSIALECTKNLKDRVSVLFMTAPVWYSPDSVDHVKWYILHTRSVELFPNGSQYIDAWHQHSEGPCDFVNATVCNVWTPRNLALNHLKTLNRIRSFKSQWQLILAGLYANDNIVNTTLIADVKAKVYLGWPMTAVKFWKDEGLNPDEMVPAINTAMTKGTKGKVVIDNVTDASEGTMFQNYSYYAAQLSQLVQGEVVV